MTRVRARLWALAQVVVAGVLVYEVIALSGGLTALGAGMARLPAGAVLLALAIYTADRVLMAYKWTLLLRLDGPGLPVLRATRIYCASMVWGLVLPATIGADTVRIASTARQGLSASKVTASVLVERVVGILATLLASALGGFLVARLAQLPEGLEPLVWVGLAGLCVGVVGFALSLSQAFYGLVTERLLGALGGPLRRVADPIRRFHAHYHAYGRSPRVLYAFFGLSIVEQLVPALAVWVLALALGAELGLLPVLGAVTVSLLLARIPISLGGIGVYEGSMVALLVASGLGTEPAMVVAVTSRIIETLGWLPWWLAQALAEGRRSVEPYPET